MATELKYTYLGMNVCMYISFCIGWIFNTNGLQIKSFLPFLFLFFLLSISPSFYLPIKSVFLFRQGLHNTNICGLRCFHRQNSGAGSKEPSCQCRRDMGSIPGLGRSPGEGPGNPLQYSCLENPTDRGAWRAAIHGVTKSQTRLSNLHDYSLVT